MTCERTKKKEEILIAVTLCTKLFFSSKAAAYTFEEVAVSISSFILMIRYTGKIADFCEFSSKSKFGES